MFSQAIKSEARNRSRPTISLGGFFFSFFLAPTVEVITQRVSFSSIIFTMENMRHSTSVRSRWPNYNVFEMNMAEVGYIYTTLCLHRTIKIAKYPRKNKIKKKQIKKARKTACFQKQHKSYSLRLQKSQRVQRALSKGSHPRAELQLSM